MAVKIRLARAGAKKTPFYRVVVADARAPRDGRFIEIIGRYNPRTDPSTIEIDVEKVDAWLAKGAQPTEAVEKLIAIAKNPEREAPVREVKPSKKSAAKAAAAQDKSQEAPTVSTEEAAAPAGAGGAPAEAVETAEPTAEAVEAEVSAGAAGTEEPATQAAEPEAPGAEEATTEATDSAEPADETPTDEGSE